MTGIVFLIIATICAAFFSISFKIFQLKDIDSMQAIFFNYATALVMGIVFSLSDGAMVTNPLKADWLFSVVILGFIFIAGMVVLSKCTETVGVAISTVCSRASMVIPIIVSYHFISGSDAPKWVPIILVIIGMALTIWTGSVENGGHKLKVMDILMPVVVFLTFGISNSLNKIIQFRVSSARAEWTDDMVNRELSLVTATIFFVAMIFGALLLLKKPADGSKRKFQWKNVLGGVGLGVANYFCTYTLMLAMKTIDSSFLFPFHNLGIVAIGAIVGWLCFKEKMRPHQIFGIVLASAAICWLCI